MKEYKKTIEEGFRKYWEKEEPKKTFSFDNLDPTRGKGRVPVFTKESFKFNLLTEHATDEEQNRLAWLIPKGGSHKWFRSMMSSQALALSVFGNLRWLNQLGCLSDLEDDEDNLVFGPADLSADNFSVEYKVTILKEPRPTSLDVFFSGYYRVAVECKFSEPEIGPCSRYRSKEPGYHCEGSYPLQDHHINLCPLAKRGVRYWDYIPLFFKWSAGEHINYCPLKYSYQLVRNVLAACVREDGTASPLSGHAVLVYDNRNPAFGEGGLGAKAFSFTKEALKHKPNLRKVSWQEIYAHLVEKGLPGWLLKGIKDKYGIDKTDIN